MAGSDPSACSASPCRGGAARVARASAWRLPADGVQRRCRPHADAPAPQAREATAGRAPRNAMPRDARVERARPELDCRIACAGSVREQRAQDAWRPRIRSAAAAPSASASAASRRRASSASALQLALARRDFAPLPPRACARESRRARRAPPSASRPSGGRSRRAPRTSSGFELRGRGPRLGGGPLGELARRSDRLLPLGHDPLQRLEQQLIQHDGQHQHEKNDPENRQIREHETSASGQSPTGRRNSRRHKTSIYTIRRAGVPNGPLDSPAVIVMGTGWPS